MVSEPLMVIACAARLGFTALGEDRATSTSAQRRADRSRTMVRM